MTKAASPSPLRLAILGSGAGSIARAVIEHGISEGGEFYTVELLICTSATSGFVDIAGEFGIPVSIVPYADQEDFAVNCSSLLKERGVDLLVLAGFVKFLPQSVIESMGGRVINTHPSLLPRHGGKGMYGVRVHAAVLDAGDTVTGVTVHWVSGEYDTGEIIDQTTVRVESSDTPESLQNRVKEAEGPFLARVISAVEINRLERPSTES